MSNLLVQNIKHTNGTTAQTIDSSGRVLHSVKPSFMAIGYQSETQDFTQGSELSLIHI